MIRHILRPFSCFALVSFGWTVRAAVPADNDPIPFEQVDASRLTATFETGWDGKTPYSCGAEVAPRVRFALDGRPVALKGVKTKVDDWMKTLDAKTVDVPTGGVRFAAATLAKPGFLRFTAAVGKKEFQRSVPFEPARLVKGSPMPDDFRSYWQGEIARLDRESPDEPTMTPVTAYGPSYDAWRVSFATVGGKRVYGILTMPKKRTGKPLPVLVSVPGAGQPTPTYPAAWIYSHTPEPNAVSMTLFAHCAAIDDKEVRDAYFARLRREHQEKYGIGYYPTAGISDGREAYHFHPVFLGAARAVRWLHRQPYADTSRFTYQGTSQGGYFGLVLAGLTPCFTKVVAIVPAGTDTLGSRAGRLSGWPRIVENQRPENRAAAAKWAPYFDAANFAASVTCPIRVLCGCIDTTCPPTAVSAAFNAIASTDKTIVYMPAHGHGPDGKAVSAATAWRRQRAASVPLDDGWEFSRDGTTWRKVGLPHDWAIESDFDPVKYDAGSGALPWKGVGWYRRTLVFSERDLTGRRRFLDFGGVQGTATVFVNGQSVAKWRYGYLGFTAPLAPYLTTGTNTVLVKADTRDWGSRWYPGAGIYRGVTLRTTDDVRLEKTELVATTPEVTAVRARLAVRGAAYSHLVAASKGTVTATLTDPSGAIVATRRTAVEIPGCALGRFALEFDVADPALWEMRDPAPLYTLTVSLDGADFTDTLVTRVGFRSFRFDPKAGFFLNGRRVQLKGVDLHSDLGILGMAFNRSAMRRQLRKMRDMGVNALRTSHNPPAEEVLDLCDEMGVFVWDEAFDKWNSTCGRGEEPLDPYVERVLRAFVRRDRNHPSVFVWSIGNEIPSGAGFAPGQETWGIPASIGTTPERCTRFRNVVREEDATRPVGIGSCFPVAVDHGDYAALDITGWNYGAQYRKIHAVHPEKPVLYSESASAFSDYGFYADALPTNKTDYVWKEFRIDSYDRNSAPWSDIPDREFERMERDPYCCGEFVWTGIDYLGEPSPFTDGKRMAKSEFARSAYFGICDLLAMPKDRAYLYRAYWNRSAFTLHIVPHHWNFSGRKALPVYVYASADEVELFVNGASRGRRRLDPAANSDRDYYGILPRYRFIWNEVPYAPGEVKAVAYGKDGRVLGEEILRTAGAPARVVVTPEDNLLPTDGETLVFAAVTLADAKGTPVPNDDRRVSFSVSGPGEIVAVGNADPHGRDSFRKVSSHKLYFGRAGFAVRRQKGRVGPIVVTAAADGLEPARVTFEW